MLTDLAEQDHLFVGGGAYRLASNRLAPPRGKCMQFTIRLLYHTQLDYINVCAMHAIKLVPIHKL